MDFFRIFFVFCLIIQAFSSPVRQNFECSGEQVLNYKVGQAYTYGYETDTTLFVNDISDEAKSEVKLATNVVVSPLGQCKYLLSLEGSSVTGESINDDSSVVKQLDSFNVVFKMNSQGELDASVQFEADDEEWSKNVKRAIVSAFQVQSYSQLRSADNTDAKSAIVYETDVLGRCRTTYRVESEDYESESSYSFEKKKSLQRCTLVTSQANKFIGGQFVPYKQVPEFYDGRLFIEDYKCKSVIKDNLISSVECSEVSTYKPGSRGIYGVQALVSQKLTFKSVSSSSVSQNTDSFESQSITFEYHSSKTSNIETNDFDATEFVSEVCNNALNNGLSNEHAIKFKDLVLTMKGWSIDQMVDFFTESQSKCDLAGLTASQAIVFAKTDNSIEAALTLIDRDSFASQKYITEYPVLTTLARNPEPSVELIQHLKTYLESKSSEFAYWNKLSLIYSTLVHTYCQNNECSDSDLAKYSSVFSATASDCSVVALKSIGNIGFFSDASVLEKCAANKENSVESRVAAIQSVRRFTCANFENLNENYNLLQDVAEDSEVRINAFLSLMRCSDESEKFALFAKDKLADLLLNEEDQQVLTFVIDYGKEHGLTTILNAALNDPKIRAKFAVQFKELSWNNYKYMYNVIRDAALELETSVIYTPKTWIPRSINFNMTTHAFGGSVNMMEANLRLEGLDEVLKAVIIDKLTSEKLMKKIMEKPEQLIEMLQIVASKLNYDKEAAKLTLSLRAYGSDVFYSNIDNKENFQRLANFIKSPRQTVLYRQVETIKNIFLVDTEIRQPLMNGLSFNRYLDVSASFLLSKKSEKENSDNELEFNVNNFWSLSGSFTGNFEINFNKENKLALKKKSMVNARLKLNVDGFKKNGHWQYNMHLSPMEKIPLMVSDGQFYKLSKNSQYKKITEFKTQQKIYTKCNSEAFKSNFGGLEFCLSVNRPDFGSLVKILKGRRQGDLEEQFKAYYSDYMNDVLNGQDNFENDNNKRPTLFLAGPYHYELNLNNPELIKTVVLDAKFNKGPSNTDFAADFSTKSQQDEQVKRYSMIYSRSRLSTYRGVNGKINFNLKDVQNNDDRLKFIAEVLYQKQEVLNVHLEVQNKVLRPFHHKLSFGRDKREIETNVTPKYHLEVLVDSQMRGPRRYNLHFDLTPNGRDVSSNFYLEGSSPRTNNQNFRALDGKLTLTSQGQGIDYTVELHAENKLRSAKLDVTGIFKAAMFKSDIEFSIDLKNPEITLPKPILVKLGHMYDGTPNARSYLRAHVEHAYRGIDHGFKALFTFDVMRKSLSFLQIDLSKPGLKQPISLFYEKNVSEKVRDVQIGVRNMEKDLTRSSSSFAQTLIKVDRDNTLRSLVIHFIRTHEKGAKIEHELYAKKNGNSFVTIKDSVFGDIAKVRSSSDELSKTSFGASFYMKVLENSGAISAQLDLEASKANKKYAAEFNFKTENLFKILSRVSSVKAKLLSANEKFNAQFEMKKLGEVKEYKLYSKSNLRRNGNKAEFDVGYKKRLANGRTLRGSGVGQFTLENFKNFAYSVDIPGHYRSSISVKNTRSELQTGFFAYHNFQFENAHLDFEPVANRFNLLIDNGLTNENGMKNVNFVFDARKGQINNLDDRDALQLLNLISSKNTLVGGNFLTKSFNEFSLKSSRFNLDLEKINNYEMNMSGLTTLTAKTNLKVPAIITDPGKLNFVTHSLVVTYFDKALTLTNRFNTDSKLFGRVFRVLNIDMDRKINAETNMVNANVEFNYKLAKRMNEEMSNWKFKIIHDLNQRGMKFLQTGYKFNIHMKQNRFLTYRSFLIGQNVQVTDCIYDEELERENSDNKYRLGVKLNVACNGKLIKNLILSIKRDYDADRNPSTRIESKSESDFVGERHIKLAHDKFTKSHGLVGVSINLSGKTPFANEFSYDRKSGDFRTAHYHVATSFGPALSKVCDLNVASGADYYNSFSCRLNTTKVPNVELNYGYNLKLANVAEREYGRKNMELNVVIPGRTLRATYERNMPAYFDGNDDDDDNNNEREFNATSTVYWDYFKQPSKSITVNAKRDNFAKGKSTTYIEFVNTPNFNSLKFKIDKTRVFNETNVVFCARYEMKSGSKNCLTLDGKLSSDMDVNSFSLETNLERPSFNTLYENKFNKNNGKLEYLGIRVGKILKLSVDKETDPEKRRISFQLTNPDESKYQFDGKSDMKGDLYTVEGTLSQGSQKLSTIVSKFNAKSTVFDVTIDGLATNNKYNFNFGVFNETLATAQLRDVNKDNLLSKTQMQIVKNEENYNELVMSMKWNRFWKQLQTDILGNTDENLAEENKDYNSYLGDVYAGLTSDLKPVVEAHRKTREAIKSDFRNLGLLLADFYSNFLGPQRKAQFDRDAMQRAVNLMEEQMKAEPNLPIYKKVLRKYNKIAKRLTALSIKLRKYSTGLSQMVPRLPTYEYNEEVNEFQNNLVVRRPTLYAKTLYQFNHEYRDYLRKQGAKFLKMKGNLIRSNLGGVGLRALINKYKYRSLSDYTLVGHVFNKRNIIGFDGEAVVLQSRCEYLLAHETQKNRFSVVLNFKKGKYPISVYAYGQKSVDIGYKSAAIANTPTSLPHNINLGENGQMSLTKTYNGVCVELNHDLRVCCYDDSKSCTVAATRWFTGKLNGLLGKADNSPQEIKQQDWYLKQSCSFKNAKTRYPTETAVKTCYNLFGRSRKSPFRNAIQAIKPEGWRNICESVLTAKLGYKCAIMRAFVHHAREEKVDINVSDECFSCKINKDAYSIGQSLSENKAGLSSNFAQGSDVVFVLLPCKSGNKDIDMEGVKKNMAKFLSNGENRLYTVKVSDNDASIFQTASDKTYNYDSKSSWHYDETTSVSKNSFNKGLFLAGSLLTQRLAQHRILVIHSCGNCLPYRLNSLKYIRMLKKSNVVVHSIGDYNIKNVDEIDSVEVPYAHGFEKIFLYNKEEKSTDSDYLDSYKIDHDMDMCSRLAIKTGGLVISSKPETVVHGSDLILNYRPKEYSYKVGTCKRLDTRFGDLTDFSYERTEIESEEDYDY